MKTLLTFLLGASLVFGMGIAAPAAPSVVSKPPTIISTGLPPCASEDSTYNCIWRADRRGNRLGTSFIVYNGGTYYLGN